MSKEEYKKAKKLRESGTEKSLYDYEDEVFDFIDRMNRKDSDWRWDVYSFEEDKVKFWWEYLNDYLGEDKHFEIIVFGYESFEGEFIAYSPQGEEITRSEESIEWVLDEIGHFAFTRY